MSIQWRPGPGDRVVLGAVDGQDLYRVSWFAAGAWRAEVHRSLAADGRTVEDHWTALGTYPSEEAARDAAEEAERTRSGH